MLLQPRGQYTAHDHGADILTLDATAFECRADGCRAQVRCADRGQAAVEPTHRGARACSDYYMVITHRFSTSNY